MRKQVMFCTQLHLSRPARILVASCIEHDYHGDKTTINLLLLLCSAVMLNIGCSNAIPPYVSDTKMTSETKGQVLPTDEKFRPVALGMELVVLKSREQLDFNVGKLVAISGVVSNTKRASILGVEIDPGDLRGKEAYAVGILSKSDESHQPMDVWVQQAGVSARATYILYADLSGKISHARERQAAAASK
jgi:hypothetical protein